VDTNFRFDLIKLTLSYSKHGTDFEEYICDKNLPQACKMSCNWHRGIEEWAFPQENGVYCIIIIAPLSGENAKKITDYSSVRLISCYPADEDAQLKNYTGERGYFIISAPEDERTTLNYKKLQEYFKSPYDLASEVRVEHHLQNCFFDPDALITQYPSSADRPIYQIIGPVNGKIFTQDFQIKRTEQGDYSIIQSNLNFANEEEKKDYITIQHINRNFVPASPQDYIPHYPKFKAFAPSFLRLLFELGWYPAEKSQERKRHSPFDTVKVDFQKKKRRLVS
jgi:hypothetical protein